MKYLRHIYLLVLLVATPAVNAYEVTPMSLVLDETGRNSTGTFRIRNTNQMPLTLELSAVRRILEDGYYDVVEPADEDFLLMPPQAYIEPGQFQIFRVRYMGEEQLSQSIGYRVVFRQLPVDLSHIEGDRVQFLMNVHAPVYVSPVGVAPALDLQISFAEIEDTSRVHVDNLDESNTAGLLVVTNHGDGLQDLSVGTFHFHFDNGESASLKWPDISHAVMIRHLLPGGESRIPLQYLNFSSEKRVVRVEFADAR